MNFEAGPSIVDSKEPERVLAWLAQSPRGTFIDYGCGEGELLREAKKLGWNAIGVEFVDDVARQLEQRLNMRVMTSKEALDSKGIADVLHLGDVIEHMTKINEQMPQILNVIRPSGILIAQGPLESHSNLFTLVIRWAHSLRRSRTTEMAPYHVMLATREGQEQCFSRFGLTSLEFLLTEVAWPAPSHLSKSAIRSPRSILLFFLRRLSQAISSIHPKWGNRYFYVGRHNGSLA
ncbi:MAG TPA: methyltransferase domain-containing protein [Pyrinomonadaceae bacterium]|nr:methyltransferase domain-containing protein [Pyrinomonadaceae bacterium]